MPIISFYALMFKQCDDYPVNPLNVIGLYIYICLIFTSREHERCIYTPALHLGPYHVKKQSQAAPEGKSFRI